MRLSVCLVIILLLVLVTSAGADRYKANILEIENQPQVDYIVTIETIIGEIIGYRYDISINLGNDTNYDASPKAITGFNLLIGYDERVLKLNGAGLGDLLKDALIDDFSCSSMENQSSDSLTRLVRIKCKLANEIILPDPDSTAITIGQLVRLSFMVTCDYTLQCQFFPIKFYWLECSDNQINGSAGDQYDYQTYLYDRFAVEFRDRFFFRTLDITDENETYSAVSVSSCNDLLDDGTYNYSKSILLKNGGILIQNDPCCCDDFHGDLHISGGYKSYERSDAEELINYLLWGPDALLFFSGHPNEAADANYDKVIPSVADLIFLIRVMNDDYKWPWDLNHSGRANFSFDGRTLGLVDSIEVGAILVVFDGEVEPELIEESSQMTLTCVHIDNETRALVYSMEDNYLSTGEILKLDKEMTLKSIDAGDRDGGRIHSIIYFSPDNK